MSIERFSVPPSGVSCLTAKVNAKEAEIFEFLDNVFTDYKPWNTIICFNGGKDCTIILHILAKYYQQHNELKDRTLDALYIYGENVFPEVDDFVKQCSETYKVNIIKRAGAMKPVLEAVCSQQSYLKAVFMGSRRTDPHCEKSKRVEKTDDDWPNLMRINPILDWTLRDIWNYIFINKVPYCPLYDMGYTSIGDTTNTHPNPHLKMVDEDTGEVSYRPAYELLENDMLERAGRY